MPVPTRAPGSQPHGRAVHHPRVIGVVHIWGTGAEGNCVVPDGWLSGEPFEPTPDGTPRLRITRCVNRTVGLAAITCTTGVWGIPSLDQTGVVFLIKTDRPGRGPDHRTDGVRDQASPEPATGD